MKNLDINSTQWRRRVCKNADKPSITSKTAIVPAAQIAKTKSVKRALMAALLVIVKPLCIIWIQRTSDNSKNKNFKNNTMINNNYRDCKGQMNIKFRATSVVHGGQSYVQGTANQMYTLMQPWQQRLNTSQWYNPSISKPMYTVPAPYQHAPGWGPTIAGRMQYGRCSRDRTL